MANDDPRGLGVLEYLALQPVPKTAKEVIEATGLGRASAYRTIDILIASGWIYAEGSPKRLRPALRLARLGLSVLSRDRVREVALSSAINCSIATGRSCSVCFYEDGCAIYTDLVTTVEGRVVSASPADVAPATATGGGKILLAYKSDAEIARVLMRAVTRFTPKTKTDVDQIRAELVEARARGFGVSDEEFAEGSGGVAYPIFNAEGDAVAALSMHSSHLTEEFVETTSLPTRKYAYESSASLGYHPTEYTRMLG